MDKHFIIYKTTNLLNGRYYIGMHITTNIDDGYLGSGRRIKAEIKKYGRENFSRVILEELPTKTSLVSREAQLVNEELRADPLCLNLKNGGEGGWDHQNTVEGIEHRRATFKHRNRAGREAFLKKFEEDNEFRAQHLDVLARARVASIETRRETHPRGTFENRRHTLATRVTMSESHQGKHSGENNSQFGTCWVTNGTPKKIKLTDLQEYLQRGYSRGRKREETSE